MFRASRFALNIAELPRCSAATDAAFRCPRPPRPPTAPAGYRRAGPSGPWTAAVRTRRPIAAMVSPRLPTRRPHEAGEVRIAEGRCRRPGAGARGIEGAARGARAVWATPPLAVASGTGSELTASRTGIFGGSGRPRARRARRKQQPRTGRPRAGCVPRASLRCGCAHPPHLRFRRGTDFGHGHRQRRLRRRDAGGGRSRQTPRQVRRRRLRPQGGGEDFDLVFRASRRAMSGKRTMRRAAVVRRYAELFESPRWSVQKANVEEQAGRLSSAAARGALAARRIDRLSRNAPRINVTCVI
jgi:hypothetical protein